MRWLSALILLSFALSSACSCGQGLAGDGGATHDAAVLDGGEPKDGGLVVDAGFDDAGFDDAGFHDAGFHDAGPHDAGSVDDAGFGDAGAVGDAGPSDGGLAADQVLLRTGVVAYLSDGPLLATDDTMLPELWEETDGGLVQRTVTALGGGVFRADSVTPGASYFTRPSSLSRGWYHSRARELSLVDPNAIGRLDAQPLSAPVPVDLNVTGLVATGSSTELLLFCPGAGTSLAVYPDPAVSQGEETLVGTGTLDFATDAALLPEGDECWLFQRVRASDAPRIDVARAVSAPFVFTLDGSGRLDLSAPLSPVPHDFLTLVLDADGATSTASATHPLAGAFAVSAALIPKPWAPMGLWPDYFDPLVEYDGVSVSSGATVLDLPRPFSSLGARNAVVVELSTLVPLRLDGTTGGGVVALYETTVEDDGEGSLSVDVAPSAAHLVTELRVDGALAESGGTLASREPRLSWVAPASGDAFGYQVNVMRLVRFGNNTGSRVAGNVWTQETEVRLPPGLLQNGEAYVFRVFSLRGGATDPTGAPVRARLELPITRASALSGVFRAP